MMQELEHLRVRLEEVMRRNARQAGTITAMQRELDALRRGGVVLYQAIESANIAAERAEADNKALRQRCDRLATINELLQTVGPACPVPSLPVPWAWRPARALTMLLTGR
jgi:predicted  nucleic acid-binding Zn-ribbon protein